MAFQLAEHTRLGHWILDGDPAHSNLLRFALTEDNFTDSTILLCVAMTTPWNIMDQLRNWATILQDHIDKLALSAEKTKKLQNESKQFVGISKRHTYANCCASFKILGDGNHTLNLETKSKLGPQPREYREAT